MASPVVYSASRNWNRLGLRGYSCEGVGTRRVAPTLSLPFTARCDGYWTLPWQTELADDEVLRLAEQQGHFDFLDDPCEDLYGWQDGEEL